MVSRATSIPFLAIGFDLFSIAGQGFVLELRANDSGAFSLPQPVKAKAPDQFGAIVSFASIPAAVSIKSRCPRGLDDVSRAAGRPMKPIHGKRDCPGVRKSVRFS